MFVIGFPAIWAICVCTALFCYFSVPCLPVRRLRITFALSLFVTALAGISMIKPGTANLYTLRFIAEMYWLCSDGT